MHRQTAIAAVFVLFVSSVEAAVQQVPYDGPLLGNSWGTAFGWTDPSFDTLSAKWVSGPTMESSAWKNMSGGWSEVYNSGDGFLATASGPATTNLGYAEVWFNDPPPGVSSVIDIVAFSGSTLIESGRLTIYGSGGNQWSWDPTAYWNPTAPDVVPLVGDAAVPEPPSLIVWSLLSLSFSGAIWWRRRKQAA